MSYTKKEILLDIKICKHIKKNPSFLGDSFYVKMYNFSKLKLINLLSENLFIEDYEKSAILVDYYIDVVMPDEEYKKQVKEIELIFKDMGHN